MTRNVKELSKAASTNDLKKMAKLGKVDYDVTGKHITARDGKIIHASDMKTIALVPGSFKIAHAGHLDMVMKYSKRADEVIVIISNPKSAKSLRKTSTGKIITAQDAMKIWLIYINKYGLKNVSVIISDKPSPITAAYEYTEKYLKDVNVIFGASTKGGDHKRWSTVQKYFKDHPINVLDPESNAVKPLSGALGDISATDIRANVEDLEMLKKLLPSKLSNKDLINIQSILS